MEAPDAEKVASGTATVSPPQPTATHGWKILRFLVHGC
jgi:hypothetical protein